MIYTVIMCVAFFKLRCYIVGSLAISFNWRLCFLNARDDKTFVVILSYFSSIRR